MVGRERAIELLERVLRLTEADQVEGTMRTRENYLTRYANNAIHQNIAQSDATLQIKAVLGKKVGIATTNSLEDEDLARAAAQAVATAKLQKDNPQFVSLAQPTPIAEAKTYYEETAGLTPEDRARLVLDICRQADQAGLEAAGAVSSSINELAIANSLGVRAYAPITSSGVTAVIMSPTGSGFAEASSRNAADLNATAVGEEAIARCQANQSPIDFDPSEMEVILSHYAVAELLGYLNYMGFGALPFQEGRSFMAGKLSQKVMDEKLTIWDDGLDPAGAPMPFDFEGVGKQKVVIIDKGVANAVVYDSFTAHREPGKRSTGHSNGRFSASAMNLFIASGTATEQEMIAQTKRGIYVTRFHYIRPIHPARTIITGMTRDGAFLVEDGRITSPVKNLRFTQSIVEAFSHVDLVGKETRLLGEFALSRVPMLKLARFNFTGKTAH